MLGKISAQLSEVKEGQVKLAGKVDALANKVDALAGKVDAQAGKVDAVRGDVKALQEAGSEEQTVLSYTSVVGPD